MKDRDRQIAETVRRACLEAAREAYEEAGMSGLCAEGRWELARGAIGGLDLDAVLAPFLGFPDESDRGSSG